mgnify:CR=1 FL=1
MNRAKLQGLLFIAFAVGCVALSGCGTGNSYDNDPNPPAADTTPPSVPANLQATAPAPTETAPTTATAMIHSERRRCCVVDP